ncbi:LemA family protein [Melissococcus plutonius]|uniref:LemA family protein n=1 Tax=Melissococcus plutonius TaxID=33970 RepID=UPI00024F2140|nr:LemA family protein [Melissococcus plutonius]BAL62654.1 LemA family protein [Melissococcus plutonius DAT561]MCV2498578.1 LemA family protein [Melissococcus plutonius]MCV2501507.1 LemA family protein [Melissococcus plutonius]MCV2504754.1 LemA family protein [Melissococcus plutonius]MCV2507214.1 LemA family protein [Melissococcus plutonius]
MEKKQRTRLVVFGILGLIIVIVIGFIIGTYNSLASEENQVDTTWSQVENVMQRRADLVPNLVNSVKGSMKQEQKVFSDITQARKNYNNAKSPNEKVKANNQLDSSLGLMINVIHENYPKLASNDNVKTLMVQLEGTENRISVERRNYIQEVNNYNQNIVRFPKNIVARLFGFEKKSNFKADEKAKKVPNVNFD